MIPDAGRADSEQAAQLGQVQAQAHTPLLPPALAWMDSIWPSLSAAPRIRHSALASRSALSSVMREE